MQCQQVVFVVKSKKFRLYPQLTYLIMIFAYGLDCFWPQFFSSWWWFPCKMHTKFSSKKIKRKVVTLLKLVLHYSVTESNLSFLKNLSLLTLPSVKRKNSKFFCQLNQYSMDHRLATKFCIFSLIIVDSATRFIHAFAKIEI